MLMTFTGALGRDDRKEISQLYSPLEMVEMVFIISLSSEKKTPFFFFFEAQFNLIAVKKGKRPTEMNIQC